MARLTWRCRWPRLSQWGGASLTLLAATIALSVADRRASIESTSTGPILERRTGWSCGAAALLSVADRVDPAAARRLGEQLRADPSLLQGARSMLDLAEAARAVGLSAAGVRVDGASHCPAPCIAHLADGHFVAVLSR